ncbi:MAG: thiamine pyrophosphate-binding protein [bacterium]|nr:thiamine pyrophosphate-binding protein [bacterium]
MSAIDGGALFGKALANEGVEKAFVLTGGHIMPIFYGMREAGIELIDTRHECAAVYACIAYTRASGKPAVVVTTAGPGVANTPAGMMEAESMSIPLLQIGGAVAMSKRDAGDLQDMSTLTLMESCCKWAKKITSTERIPEYVSMAFRHAMDSTPGPVYLEVPTDLVFAEVEEKSVRFPASNDRIAIPQGETQRIEEAADLLANAKRPAMIIDDGARWSMGEHAGAIAELSKHLKMPVGIAGNVCRGLFGDELANPLLKTNSMAGADVVLAMSCRFDFRLASGRLIPDGAKVIQVHTDRRQIGFNVRADLGIVGGSGPIAAQLLESVKAKCEPNSGDPWTGADKSRGAASLPEPFRDASVPVHPARCAGEVARFLEQDARDWDLVIDGGEASVWMGMASTAARPGQIHATGANGTIGTGPGLVIGAWAANRKPVLWYTGDGSFGFYPMEMDTMARLGIPVVCVISNDSGWGMIRLAEKYIRPTEISGKGQCNTELQHMRAYEKMTAMWEGHGERVTDPDEILPAIRRAAANGKPSIINVEVDDVSLSPFIAGYAKMVAPAG